MHGAEIEYQSMLGTSQGETLVVWHLVLCRNRKQALHTPGRRMSTQHLRTNPRACPFMMDLMMRYVLKVFIGLYSQS